MFSIGLEWVELKEHFSCKLTEKKREWVAQPDTLCCGTMGVSTPWCSFNVAWAVVLTDLS